MIQQSPTRQTCPNCLAGQLAPFATIGSVPAHSVLLLKTREEAVEFPRGEIQLSFCAECGFVSNSAFDTSLHDYSAEYEATQSFSGTFNTFHRRLANTLIDRYQLRQKRIIEVGCGQGEFIEMLSELGSNHCLGFDPAYRGPAATNPAAEKVAVIPDFYGEKYAGHQADFVCCKMTLEHIHHPASFVRTLRRSLGQQPEAVVFIQVPDATRIWRDVAFWDVYYEHCSYFTPGSLTKLFTAAGFCVRRVETEYDGQYLMLEAANRAGSDRPIENERELDRLAQWTSTFAGRMATSLERWNERLTEVRAGRRRAVLWGGGSKGVAFLNALGIGDEIPFAVDINPRKHGCYMAGTGQEVVPPKRLQAYRPDMVIVMNPIYTEEIRQNLEQLGVEAELWPLE